MQPQAGLSPALILRAIDHAERTDFDLSPAGLSALAKAGVSNEVIEHAVMVGERPR